MVRIASVEILPATNTIRTVVSWIVTYAAMQKKM